MKCKKCGSEHLKLEQLSHETNEIMEAAHVVLICGNCGFWQKWCPKEERHHYIKKTMANREWLNGLSDEEFVSIIGYKVFTSINSNGEYKQSLIDWLKAEHEDKQE